MGELNFPHKTPQNFYGFVDGIGLAEQKNEGELWLEKLPRDSIIVRPEFYFSALEAGYSNYDVGLKDGEAYYVLIPRYDSKKSDPIHLIKAVDGSFFVKHLDLDKAIDAGYKLHDSGLEFFARVTHKAENEA